MSNATKEKPAKTKLEDRGLKVEQNPTSNLQPPTSTPEPRPTPTHPSMIVATENVHCPCCSACIPRENVAMNFDRDKYQVFKVKCDFCNTIFRETRVLVDGSSWQTRDVERVDDPKEIESFNARIDHLKGNVQRGEPGARSQKPE